jgi:hypothetical protein
MTAAGRERNELRIELRRERAEHPEETVGNALLTAAHAGEALLAEAREKAASIIGEAEAQALQALQQSASAAEKRGQATTAMREQLERELATAREALEKDRQSARAEAEADLVDARRELAALEVQATQLRSQVSELGRRLVEIARGTLKELDGLGAETRSSAPADLLEHRHSSLATSTPTAAAQTVRNAPS